LCSHRPDTIQPWKIIVAPDCDACGFQPALGKGGLQEAHYWTFDSHIGIAPMLRHAPIAGPCFTDSIAAGKSNAAINHQNTPVTPIIVTQQTPRKDDAVSLHLPKVLHVTASLFHRPNNVSRHLTRSMTVQKNVCFDTCSAALGKRVSKLIAYRTTFVKILSEGDCGFCALDVT
jgi:hypothetical protein